MGGAVYGTIQVIPPQGALVRNTDCCEEGVVDRSRRCQYGQSRPFRLRHPADRAGVNATIASAAYGGTDECCDPDSDYYTTRDSRYTHSQLNRPTFDIVWGSQTSQPPTATGMSAAAAISEPPNPDDGAQRHPVPLDAPDVALRGQRLLTYGEKRLCREEAGTIQEPGRARPTDQPHRPQMDCQAPEIKVRQPSTPLLVNELADAGWS